MNSSALSSQRLNECSLWDLWGGSVSGMTEAGFRAAATQVGEHLHVALPEGGDLYLAWTTLGAFDLPA